MVVPCKKQDVEEKAIREQTSASRWYGAEMNTNQTRQTMETALRIDLQNRSTDLECLWCAEGKCPSRR